MAWGKSLTGVLRQVLLFVLLIFVIQLPVMTELDESVMPYPNEWWRVAFFLASFFLAIALTRHYLRQVSDPAYLNWQLPNKKLRALVLTILLVDMISVSAYIILTKIQFGDQIAIQSSLQFNALSIRFWLYLVVTCLSQPILEGLLYRGCLLGALRPYSAWGAVLMSSLIFSLSYGIDAYFGNNLVFGLLYAWLTLKTERVWPSMLCQVIHNSLLVAAIFWLV